MADRVLQYGVESECVRMQSLSTYIRMVAEWYAQNTENKCDKYCGEGVCEGLNERVKVWTVDKLMDELETSGLEQDVLTRPGKGL